MIQVHLFLVKIL